MLPVLPVLPVSLPEDMIQSMAAHGMDFTTAVHPETQDGTFGTFGNEFCSFCSGPSGFQAVPSKIKGRCLDRLRDEDFDI